MEDASLAGILRRGFGMVLLAVDAHRLILQLETYLLFEGNCFVQGRNSLQLRVVRFVENGKSNCQLQRQRLQRTFDTKFPTFTAM
jgi:hypothetical protein